MEKSEDASRKRARSREKFEKKEETPRRKRCRVLRSRNPCFRKKEPNCLVDETKIEFTSIPVEILLEIMSYLNCQDLYSLRRVSKYFERLVLEPTVWTAYEVNSTGPSTQEVLDELKRMPHLRRINIEGRTDCDDILRQLSRTNKKLQRLNILNCTGTTANLYLRPAYLIRILERCTRLHTITICGSRFRGLKFYRILGEMGHRLRFVSASTTCMQFRTFAEHVSRASARAKEALCAMCPGGARRWGPLRYYMVERSDRTKTAFVSYFYHDFLYVVLRPATESQAKIVHNSPITACS